MQKGQRPATAAVQAMRGTEVHLKTYEPYLEFVNRLQAIRTRFAISSVKNAKGKTVYVYGASTRGNTLPQYFGLDSSLPVAAAGVTCQIRQEDGGHQWTDHFGRKPRRKPITCLCYLAFIDEFVKRETTLSGGKFIVPLPDFRLIGSEG